MTGPTLTRRALLRASGAALAAGAAGAGLAACGRGRRVRADARPSAVRDTRSLNDGWLFGGVYTDGAQLPDHPETSFAPVTLPHTVTALGWGGWNPELWEQRWIYRRHISSVAASGGRVFVDFQGVMTSATVWCNGVVLATHQGGYLPFSVELTDHLVAGDNVLAVGVDATMQNVPPNSVVGGPAWIDYLQPGGIYRDVTLRVVPDAYVVDVFAKPVDVLTAPALQVLATLDRGAGARPLVVSARLSDPSGATIAQTTEQVPAASDRYAQVSLSLDGLSGIGLWSPQSPTLYGLAVTVADGAATHTFTTRTGFREAVFREDGFFLNGQRYEIFGLNHHQLLPYLGMAGPARLQRRDAEILRQELACNMVRCSHYPQSEHFLDACDELGLMVWQEPPGWQYVGDAPFRTLVLENVQDMVLRDRSRPSLIVWATRLNESPNEPSLYAQTGAIARTLDGTRQTTGSMRTHSRVGWNQQVFAFDDYDSLHDEHRVATLKPPLPGVPYMVSESVGALSGAPRYLWIDPAATLALQGRMHAEVHSIAQSDPGYAGLLGWCGFDYQTLNGGRRIWNALKSTGVTDVFRVAKPGAGAYASQLPVSQRVVIAPGFFWDFGPASPPHGPGHGAIVFTNCEQLDFYVGAATNPTAIAHPDTVAFPGLASAPMLVDLPTVDGTSSPPLRIEGLVGGEVVATLQMSSDVTEDVLSLTLEDEVILADGSDATRFRLRIVDRYGNGRPLGPSSDLRARFALSGPGVLIADNPFDVGFYGGVAGGFIRSLAGEPGEVMLTASCPGYGPASAWLQTVPGTSPAAALGSGGARVLNAPPSPAQAPASLLRPHEPAPGRRPRGGADPRRGRPRGRRRRT